MSPVSNCTCRSMLQLTAMFVMFTQVIVTIGGGESWENRLRSLFSLIPVRKVHPLNCLMPRVNWSTHRSIFLLILLLSFKIGPFGHFTSRTDLTLTTISIVDQSICLSTLVVHSCELSSLTPMQSVNSTVHASAPIPNHVTHSWPTVALLITHIATSPVAHSPNTLFCGLIPLICEWQQIPVNISPNFHLVLWFNSTCDRARFARFKQCSSFLPLPHGTNPIRHFNKAVCSLCD